MNPSVIEGLLIFAGGMVISLIAYRVIPLPKDNRTAEETMNRWGRFMRIVGPMVSLWGIYMTAQAVR